MKIESHDKRINDFLAALGLKLNGLRSVLIRIEADNVVTVEAEYFVEDSEQLHEELQTLSREFVLVERGDA